MRRFDPRYGLKTGDRVQDDRGRVGTIVRFRSVNTARVRWDGWFGVHAAYPGDLKRLPGNS